MKNGLPKPTGLPCSATTTSSSIRPPAVSRRVKVHPGSASAVSKASARVLLADDRDGTVDSVERLMGTKAEARFAFISDKAEFASDDLLDV